MLPPTGERSVRGYCLVAPARRPAANGRMSPSADPARWDWRAVASPFSGTAGLESRTVLVEITQQGRVISRELPSTVRPRGAKHEADVPARGDRVLRSARRQCR